MNTLLPSWSLRTAQGACVVPLGVDIVPDKDIALHRPGIASCARSGQSRNIGQRALDVQTGASVALITLNTLFALLTLDTLFAPDTLLTTLPLHPLLTLDAALALDALRPLNALLAAYGLQEVIHRPCVALIKPELICSGAEGGKHRFPCRPRCVQLFNQPVEVSN
ncbi:hypothetical protein D1820_01835 [Phaeobacter sp. LSS9]|nr:hypothetical protein D1820_01835 [Phaeobacter sp. LSS9]